VLQTLRREGIGDAAQPEPHARLGGSLGDAELVGDLAVRATTEIRELDRGALFGRQLLDLGAHVLRGDDRDRELVDIGNRQHARGVARVAPAARFLAAHVVDRAAVRERADERSQSPPRRVEDLGALPQAQEDVLGDVLGGPTVADHPGREPVDVGAELVVELRQRRVVARDEAGSDVELPGCRMTRFHSGLLGARWVVPGVRCDPGFRIRICLLFPAVSDLFDIAGKTALVTGGSRGIGLMIARGYVHAGAKVYISSRKAEVCDEVAAELSGTGVCTSVPADLSQPGECARLAAEIAAHEDRLHILVNNAGATWGAPLAEYPEDAWDKVLGLNVKAPFLLTQALVPLLEAAASADDPARVINIGSIDAIQVPMLETYAYSSSKAAIHQQTRHLARMLGPRNITVNAVAPGPFESKMMAETLRNFGDAIARSSPLGRIGRPDDMAGVAIYLASRAGAYVTGAVIPVDGGIATTK